MRLNQAAAGLIAAILLISLTSCGDETPKAVEPTPATPTSSATETPEPTATPTPVTDEDKAAAALLAYLEVRDNAYATGRISKKLNKYATGREHFNLQQLVTLMTTGVETRYVGEWSHQIVRTNSQNNGSIRATDCQDGGDVKIVRQGDNKELPWIMFNSEELPRRLEQVYQVEKYDGRWKVESLLSLPNDVTKC